jgi:hypothetical protein
MCGRQAGSAFSPSYGRSPGDGRVGQACGEAAPRQSCAGTPRGRGMHRTTQRDEHRTCTKEEMPTDVWMVGGGRALTSLRAGSHSCAAGTNHAACLPMVGAHSDMGWGNG